MSIRTVNKLVVEDGDNMAKRYDDKRRLLRTGEYQRPDGIYTYRTTVDGKRHTITSTSLGELRLKEEEITEQIEKGLDLDKQNLTLNDLADKYLDDKAKTVQRSTICIMRNMYNLYVRNTLGNRQVSEIKKSHVKDLYLDMLDKNNLSIATIMRMGSILKPMFEVAVDDDIIIKNPAKGVVNQIKKEKGYVGHKKSALTERQAKAFLDFVMTNDKYDNVRNLFVFLLGTGCRVGEATAITWNDIDFQNGIININHSVAYVRENGSYIQFMKVPKTAAGIRQIPMLDNVREALIRERERQEMLGVKTPELDGYTDFVFLSTRGTIYRRETVAHNIREIIHDYNAVHKYEKLPDFSTHQLRHTFATLICKNTSDLKAIQHILGHADITTTMNIYADATKDGVDKSMRAMEGVMFN